MNRCQSVRARIALAAFLSLAVVASVQPLAAGAQESMRREAPRDVILGKMGVITPPDITMDGKPDRLSPGSRIRDRNNMLVLSSSLSTVLAGATVPVLYRRDSAGLVHEVWILSADEYSKLAGIRQGTPEGVQSFLDMLALIFGNRK
jgi:hypothetical protein